MRLVALAATSLIGLLAIFSSCSGMKGKADTDSKTGAKKTDWHALPRETAVARSKHLTNVSYDLWLKLPEDGDFEGRVTIQFDTKKPKGKQRPMARLPIDFSGGKVKSIAVNGMTIADPAPRYDGQRIYFDWSEIKDGHNKLEISYTHPYSAPGQGLVRSKDTADGQVYLYTDLEPYDANRVFPCFDQPDLRATFEITAEAPASWQVISNTREREVSGDGRVATGSSSATRVWAFPKTALLSTYLVSLDAGPWQSWTANAGKVPLRLFARKSVASQVDSKAWFETTRKGIEFFEEQFQTPYPYAKYDQILAPEFNGAASESVAAAVFSEELYAFRGRESKSRHQQRARTILHELAHMWAGDLVGVRWWSGLWLSEGFAAYYASAALEASGDKEAWLDFFTSKKQSTAYYEDQLVTTHPVDSPVPDTEVAHAALDGIAYGKGAALIKQFRELLGDDDFREGLHRYFSHYSNKTASVADFFKMFAEASGKDLKSWQRQWLRSPGLNTIRTEVACAAETDESGAPKGPQKITKLTVNQGNGDYSPELRAHQTEVALFDEAQGRLKPSSIFPVPYTIAETEVPDAVGKPCPAFVFPNHRDLDYVKVLLEGPAADFALKNVSRFRDSLTRQMIWHTLWESVIDGRLKAQDYADAVIAQIGTETEPVIIASILMTMLDSKVLRSGGDPGVNRINVLRLINPPARYNYALKLDELAKAKLLAAPRGSDLQMTWYQAAMDAIVQPTNIQFIRQLLAGKAKVRGLKLEPERRWEAILALARVGEADTKDLIQAELAKDPTEAGKREAIRAEALMPDPTTKKLWLSRIMDFPDTDQPPVSKLKEAGRFFHQLGQEQLSRDSIEPYFQLLPKLSRVHDEEFTLCMVGPLFPPLCDPAIDERAAQFISQHPELPAAAVKVLKTNIQEDQRCVRGRQKSG